MSDDKIYQQLKAGVSPRHIEGIKGFDESEVIQWMISYHEENNHALLEACLRIQAQFRQAGIESKAGSLNPVEDNAAQIDAAIIKALGQ